MNVIAINGSPRKKWNTHTLLTKALEGAASKGANTELINLYDLKYTGCISCLACQMVGGPSNGKCAVKDDLKPLLEKIHKCDALILGSPIYFSDVTGMMRSFMERLLFQYLTYGEDYGKSKFNRRIKTFFLYTMNVPEVTMEQVGYDKMIKRNEALLDRILGPSQSFFSTETLQIDGYSKYNITVFNEEQRKRRREEVFPLDCQKVFEIGSSLVK